VVEIIEKPKPKLPKIERVVLATDNQRRMLFRTVEVVLMETDSKSLAFALDLIGIGYLGNPPVDLKCKRDHDTFKRRPVRLRLYEDQIETFDAAMKTAQEIVCFDEGCAIAAMCRSVLMQKGKELLDLAGSE